MSTLSGRPAPAVSNSNKQHADGQSRSEVTSHALNSDLEDVTPHTSDSSGARSDYSPRSQPFAERPENRTEAGVAARQTLSSLPSPPPFTPLAGLSSPGQMSEAGSNSKPGTAGDTPGVTSAWQQPGPRSPGSSSVTFAFTPVATGDVASPDGQPFGRGSEQASAAQQRPPAPAPPAVQLPKAADFVRAVERRLSASHDSDAMSDASGSVCSTTSTQRSLQSSGLPAGSPGDILRAATSKLSAQHAISGSSRIQNPQRRKSGALKTPLQQKLAPAPTPHSTPMDAAEAVRPEEQATADSTVQKAASPAAPAAAAALPPSGSLKVHVVGSPVVASPGKQGTKSPGSVGSRSSVVSIGSVCGAASLTPRQAMGPGGDELEAGRYTPTMKLDFGGSPSRTPAVRAAAAAAAPGKHTPGQAAVAASPGQCSDVGESATPAKSPPATPTDSTPLEMLPDDLTGMVEKMQFSGNKSVLRDAFTTSDVGGLQDQLQALLDEAGEETQAALGVKPGATAAAAAAGSAAATAASSGPGVSRRDTWFSRSRGTLLLLLAGLCILLGSMVAVQMLPVSVLPPGAVCTPQNAAACKAALAAQLAAADKQPSRLRRVMMEAKWYAQDVFTIFWTRRLPEGVTLDQAQQVWLSNVSSKQVAKMSAAEAEALFGSLPEHLRSPEISAKLAASAAQKAQQQAEARKAAERAEAQRVAAAKAEAERRAAEEARIAREKAEAAQKAEAARLAKEKAEAERVAKEKAAEAERLAKQKAEAERVAREKAAAERRAKEKAAAEQRAAEEARLAAERAEAARQAAERAEAERRAEEARAAAEAAEAERLAAERAAAAEQEAAARLASEQAEQAAAAAKAKRSTAWVPYLGLFVLLASVAGAGGFFLWQRAAIEQEQQQQQLDEIRTLPDDDMAYQNLGQDDEGDQQAQEQEASGAAASAAAAVAAAGAAAAGALAAGAAVATRILTPRVKAPPHPDLAGQQQEAGITSDEGEEAAPARRGRRAGSSKAAAAARTPSSARRGSRAAAAAAAAGADSGVESDGGASTGRARGTRGRKAAATPGRTLAPLLEDAPAEPTDALTSGDEAAAGEEEAPRRGGTRRQSAPAASRRRSSTAAAAADAAATEAATPTVRRTSRQARTPRV